jgi:hypothetical protein
MAMDNLFITYREHRRDMKAFPPGSPAYNRAKEKLSEFLRYVKEKHGQDVVDTLTSEK